MSKKKGKNTQGKFVATHPNTHTISKATSLNWAYLFLFLFAIVLYINTIGFDFAFDDTVVITGNKFTRQGFAGIPNLITKDLFSGIYGTSLDLEGGRWRPITLVMFAIEYQFFGDHATPYHIINVLLYGVTAIVLFLSLLQIFSLQSNLKQRTGELLAFVTTLLFIAHPIHTEVVANIKSRDEIISFLFLSLTLYLLFKYLRTIKSKFMILASLSYFVALLSKENGITFIAVIPLCLFFFSEKNIRQIVILSVPFVVTAGIYLAIRTSLVGMIGDRISIDITDNPFMRINFPRLPTSISYLEKLATVLWIVFKYLLLLIFPHPLTSDYGFNQIPAIGFSNPKALIPLVSFLVLIVFAFKVIVKLVKNENANMPSVKNHLSFFNLLAFSISYFFITISIVSNLFFLIGTTMGERFVYITSLGFSLVLAAYILKISKTESEPLVKQVFKNPRITFPLLLILIPYSFKTITRNNAWRNNKTLFTADVKTSINSANAHYYYANTLFTEHMSDDPSPARDSLYLVAKKEFTRGLEINPYFHYCYYNIGLIWEKLGQPDSAISWHQRTINLQPPNSMAQYMAKGALGLVYGKLKGDIDHAIPLLKEAIANKPEDTGYHENLGICYAMKHDFDGSIKEFEESIRLKSDPKIGKGLTKEDARLYRNLGISWKQKDSLSPKGEEYFKKALQLDSMLTK